MSIQPINSSGTDSSGTINVSGDVSGNIQTAMALIVSYLNSTYHLQAADTKLEATITNAEAELVNSFQTQMMKPGDSNDPYNTNKNNYLWQMENLSSKDDNYQEHCSILTNLYTNASMQNQALTKTMDANNSTAQNTLSQNSQGQSGLMQTMSAINQQQANLARDIQG
jgi:hypothetical protein